MYLFYLYGCIQKKMKMINEYIVCVALTQFVSISFIGYYQGVKRIFTEKG